MQNKPRTDISQLQEELDWASGRPRSRWAGDSPCTVGTDGAFEDTLTQSELDFLRGYEDKCPGAICSLNQNPDVTCMASTGKATSCKQDQIICCLCAVINVCCQ